MEEALESRQTEVRTQNDDAEPCEKKKGAAHRRPRVRVVSSRFMSPVAPASSSSSSSTSLDCPGSLKCPIPRRAPPPSSCSSSSSSSSLGTNLRGSQSALRRRASNSCPSTDDDEGEGDDTDDDCASLDSTPIKPDGGRSIISRPLRPAINQQFNFHPSPFASGLQQGKRRGAKQSKEIVELTENVDPLDGNRKVMNTMIPKRSTVGRTPKTTFVYSQNLLRHNPHGGVVSSASTTAAARLVQSNGLVPGKNEAPGCGLNAETVRGGCSSDTISSQAIICDSPPLPVHGSNAGKGRAMHGCRSSMPESDLLPTMSRKTLVEMSRSTSGDPFGDQYHKSVAPLCSRSLNSTLLSCQQSIFADSPSKSVCKSVTASKCYPSPTKTSSTYLPPHPSNAKNVASVMKPAVEPMKRGKKLSGHQEDAHLLRLLYNRHLQWRFTNAKAEAAMHAQTISAERSLHCLWAKISEMQQSVSSKRAEIERLKASRRIRSILDGQVDCKAIQQAVSVGADNLQAISCYVQNFMPMVEAASSNASALASIVNREKAMVEDCEALLSMAHALQIQECSLRSNLVQLSNRRSHSGQATLQE
ncbi:AUGMIN subunit 8-like isoform X2 [Nymphaea colorata]|uniref:AUGMIN subunit 8-like isoform X2 n=1 Tax=Nymphaea colorata TaxID=210225 RepID=UPI00214E5B1B|nr:AUGMIN subunit 8-like isoform X2 [Nymphaea colorata]